ncbi:MAG: peptide/bleomycin uptake transporter [Gammaproteobacteria bacterium]|jgi:peptide/bleomycin uptake transporter
MFKSFFPNPKVFFLSLIVYAGLSCFIWFGYSEVIGGWLGLELAESEPVIGSGHFFTDSFLLFYGYYFFCTALFSIFWFKLSHHPWRWWSITGSAFIIFTTYYSVQVSVAINNWRGPFFNKVQAAFKKVGDGGSEVVAEVRAPEDVAKIGADILDLSLVFLELAMIAIFVIVLTRFFVSHYIFRWRTAMNKYYTERWQRLRKIEGASQRVQEDTMIFAKIMENLGVSIIDSIMTLFAFLPVLLVLSDYVKELPIVGEIAYPLFFAVIAWSLFGTILLATVGIKLPGLEFNNQLVEAAYRKELVYGEDDETRAQPAKLKDLFENVRKNYFKLYFHYMYFNVARYMYLQADNIFVLILLVPTLAVGALTFGVYQQISAAFGQVSSSFQFLINSWPTIIELISVYKRLSSFEAAIEDKPLPAIDQDAISR